MGKSHTFKIYGFMTMGILLKPELSVSNLLNNRSSNFLKVFCPFLSFKKLKPFSDF
jgi:hypothetical protein